MIGSLVGPYRLTELLGEGGMGAVYVGHHTILRSRVLAIKVLLPHLTRHEQLTQRFINEGIAAASLQSEHIIKIHDCQQDPRSGLWWIAMERLEGQTLSKYLASQRQPLSLATTIQIGAQIAEALDEAHAHGIIHRDMKPDNVFLVDRDGNPTFVKVLDFGIAKLRRDASGVVTKTNLVLGTPLFMPPEQLRGLPIDHRVDVFALTVVLYLMLSGGVHPFQFSETLDQLYQVSSAELCIRQLQHIAMDIRGWNPNLLPAVGQVLATGLHRDREVRPKSAGDLIVELARAGGELEVVEQSSNLLAPNAARRSIQVPVQEAPIDTAVRERVTVRLSPPRYEAPRLPSTAPDPANPSTTLGSAASQAVPSVRTKTRVVGLALASTAVLAGAVGAVSFAIDRIKNKHDEHSLAATPAVIAEAPRSAVDAAIDPRAIRDAALEVTTPAPIDASAVAAGSGSAGSGSAGSATNVDGNHRGSAATVASHAAPARPTAKGRLTVSTAEKIADVFVDGKFVGSTPLPLFELPVGPHKIMLVAGDKRETVPVNVTSSKPTVIERPW